MSYVPFCKQWEGGLSRDKNDSASSFPCPTSFKDPKDGVLKSGWHTNVGVTYSVWVNYFGKDKDDRFFKMSDQDWGVIFKAGYWDKVKGDLINHQSIANCLVSWAWGSGSVTAIKQMQRVLGFEKKDQDGKIGNQTIGAINNSNEKELFEKCIKERESFFRFISDPNNTNDLKMRVQYRKNQSFLKGWLNRLSAFEKKFKPQ